MTAALHPSASGGIALPSSESLVANFCHDCRTPLTVIAESAAIVRDEIGRLAGPDAIEFLGLIAARTHELETLIDDFQFLSRRQRGMVDTASGTLALRDLAAELEPPARAIAEARDRRLDIRLQDEPVWLAGNPKVLLRALPAMISECSRMARKGGMLRIDLKRSGDRVRLAVTCGPEATPMEAGEGSTDLAESFRLQTANMLLAGEGGRLSVVEAGAAVTMVALLPCHQNPPNRTQAA